MNFRLYILFFISSILILIQFILDPNIIVNNDLNGNIVPLLHFKESILVHNQFPQWNPYINQGIPTVADPLYGIYNPLIGIPILLFPYHMAIKVMYFFAIFLSCISMFKLLKLFKISNIVSSIIAITYASGTYLSSRIIAGHLEKVISFAFLPLFLLCLIKMTRAKNVLWSGLTAIILSLILFSGDIYNTLFCLYALAAVFIFYLFKDRKVSIYVALTVVFFLLFSSIKILPMIQLQDYISKIKEPFVGGLNILSITYNLFFPFDLLIPKAISLKHLSTGFGWWESLSFIGPLSFLGLFFILRSAFAKHDKGMTILVLLTVLFILLSTPDSRLNPFHYITSTVETLQYFHVPSRILALWGIIILLSLGIFLDKWNRRRFAISLLLVNLLVVYAFSQSVLANRKFEKISETLDAPLNWIKNNNKDNYYTVHDESQGYIPQDKAYLNNLLMLQSNYGLFLKRSLGEKYNFRGNSVYDDIKPGFLITNTSTKNHSLIKIKDFDSNTILYRNLRALPFARIDNVPQEVSFSPNKITILANSKGKNRLILLETNYPGWATFVDGKKTQIFNGRFLEVETLPGKYKYEFIYSSRYFCFGLLISGISLGSWLLYISKKRIKKIIA